MPWRFRILLYVIGAGAIALGVGIVTDSVGWGLVSGGSGAVLLSFMTGED